MNPAWQQFFLILGMLVLTDIAARGSGTIARAFYILSAVGSCVYYMRKSPWQYLTMSLWFWSVTPLARRLIDWHAGFDPVNFVLGVPEMLSLLMMWNILNSRELMRQRETLIGLFIAVPILYAVGVSFVQGQVTAGLIGSADWLGPILYYFYVISNWRRIGELEPIMTRFLAINMAALAVYCIFQFITAPAWDAAWLVNSGTAGMGGTPEPFGIRIFGTLNASGILASWFGTGLLLLLHFKNRITPILVPVLAMLIILTYVRSAAGAVLAAYIVAALLGRGGIFKMLIIGSLGVAITLAAISSLLPDVNDMIVKRASSVEDLGHDTSANARADLWQQAPRAIAAAPFGLGIGAIGRGAVSKQDGDELVVIDFGVLGIYLPLGWVGGTVYIVGIALMLVQAWSAARLTRSSAAIALTAASAQLVFLLPFFNILGLYAMLLWLCAGYAAALGMQKRTSRMIATRPVDRLAIQRTRSEAPIRHEAAR